MNRRETAWLITAAAMVVLGAGLLAAGCRDHDALTKHDYVAEMRHLPLGRLVFGFSAQISPRNWERPRARQHMLQRLMRRSNRANRAIAEVAAVCPPHEIAVFHDELVAAAARVSEAIVNEANLLRTDHRTREPTYADYLFKFEALQRQQQSASSDGGGAYYAIKHRGYDIGPDGIEALAPR